MDGLTRLWSQPIYNLESTPATWPTSTCGPYRDARGLVKPILTRNFNTPKDLVAELIYQVQSTLLYNFQVPSYESCTQQDQENHSE